MAFNDKVGFTDGVSAELAGYVAPTDPCPEQGCGKAMKPHHDVADEDGTVTATQRICSDKTCRKVITTNI